MCVQVRNVETDDEADSPSALRKMLGVKDLVLSPNYKAMHEDSCLCQIDVEATVKAAGWEYREVDGDYMEVEVVPPKQKL